ncbi:hypothetical protein [Dietzia sp. 179-F 9C3 NHS]|uniref:hypothetical protein n=1 Tax=Dietzia sp. 179-F 9C3 NHS TaxID=3374295 RepID=UPI003879B398
MDDGITLTNNGRSWVSVANPLRGDSVAAAAHARASQEPDVLRGIAGTAAVAAAAIVGAGTALAGAPPVLAVLAGLIVLPLVWVLVHQRLQRRAGEVSTAVATRTEGLGPRRILRGDFLPGERADAADTIVMGAVHILQSSSYRSGALGDTSAVYHDILDSTWGLLHKLQVLEGEVVECRRLASRAEDEQSRRDIEKLTARAEQVWEQQLVPLVAAHRELVQAVDELDRFLDTPHARDRGAELASAPDFARRHSSTLDALSGRVAAALEASRTGPDQPPDLSPGAGMAGL